MAIPNQADLRDQLIGPEYEINLRGEYQLERKEDMRRRGLASPDIADALALTFARPVFPKQYDDRMGTGNVVSEYESNQEGQETRSVITRRAIRDYSRTTSDHEG